MSLKLIDAVYDTLKDDQELMGLLKLQPSSSAEEISKRITKGNETDVTLSKDTIPHMTIYIKPGSFDRNFLVYKGKFGFDIYGKTAYECTKVFERIFTLLHDKRIVRPGFHSYLCTLAYDNHFTTGIQHVRGYEAIFDVDYLRMN